MSPEPSGYFTMTPRQKYAARATTPIVLRSIYGLRDKPEFTRRARRNTPQSNFAKIPSLLLLGLFQRAGFVVETKPTDGGEGDNLVG